MGRNEAETKALIKAIEKATQRRPDAVGFRECCCSRTLSPYRMEIDWPCRKTSLGS
jgi:hypothetical protein